MRNRTKSPETRDRKQGDVKSETEKGYQSEEHNRRSKGRTAGEGLKKGIKKETNDDRPKLWSKSESE